MAFHPRLVLDSSCWREALQHRAVDQEQAHESRTINPEAAHGNNFTPASQKSWNPMMLNPDPIVYYREPGGLLDYPPWNLIA